MAEPKKRLTSTRSGKRRSHEFLQTKSLALCPKCKNPVLPHRVCQTCGFYKGEDFLKLEEKAKAKESRRKDREAKEKANEEREKK